MNQSGPGKTTGRALATLYFALSFASIVAACGGGGDGGADSDGGGGSAGVCGDVSSTPLLCDLRVRPDPAERFGTLRVSFGVSDREGDIDKACIGIAVAGVQPVIQCEAFPIRGSRINERLETDPIDVGASPPGTYAIALNVGDREGHVSNTITTTFRVR